MREKRRGGYGRTENQIWGMDKEGFGESGDYTYEKGGERGGRKRLSERSCGVGLKELKEE